MQALFFDLDDTLLNSKKNISERNKNAIIKCSEMGYKIGYITARSPRKMHEFLENLPCDCIAYYNGACIYAENKMIAEYIIEYKDAIAFIRNIEKKVPLNELSAYFEPLCYRNGKVINCVSGEIMSNDIYSAPQYNFQRIRLVFDEYDISEIITSDMQYQTTVDKSVIITNIKANKGKALETLMRYYNLSKNQAISFGDDINDIPMLQASGIGVAMGNAVKEVKNAANYVTLSNDEDGVAEYIETFLV